MAVAAKAGMCSWSREGMRAVLDADVSPVVVWTRGMNQTTKEEGVRSNEQEQKTVIHSALGRDSNTRPR